MRGTIVVKRTPASSTVTNIVVDIEHAPGNGDTIIVAHPQTHKHLQVILDTPVTWNNTGQGWFSIAGAPAAGADYDAWIA